MKGHALNMFIGVVFIRHIMEITSNKYDVSHILQQYHENQIEW